MDNIDSTKLIFKEITNLINDLKTSAQKDFFPKLQTRQAVIEERDSCVQEKIKDSSTKKINLNISGKIFSVSLADLASEKDSVFYKMIYHSDTYKFMEKDEWFFDRSPEMFEYIVKYLETKKFDVSSLEKYKDQVQLRKELKYYEMYGMLKILNEIPEEVEIIDYYGNPYIYNGMLLTTNSIEDLKSRNNTRGFAISYPGEFLIELNYPWYVKEIIYSGLKSIHLPTFIDNVVISVGETRSCPVTVGRIPKLTQNDFVRIDINKKNVRYIKFFANSLFGIGYLKIIPN